MARASYKDWINEDGLARIESWARDGLTDEQISNNIGCSRSTIYEWAKKHSCISDALKRGRAPIDLEVENLLLKRARGFEYEEIETVIEVTPDGEQKQRVRKMKRVALPDTGAIIFWLKNRKPDVWRRMSPEFKRKTDLEADKLKAEIRKIEEEMKQEESTEQVIIVDDLAEAEGLLNDH